MSLVWPGPHAAPSTNLAGTSGRSPASTARSWTPGSVNEVYGQHSRLRAKCEELGLSYVLAVGVNQRVIAGPGRFDGQEFFAEALIAALPVPSWRTISAGKGAKG